MTRNWIVLPALVLALCASAFCADAANAKKDGTDGKDGNPLAKFSEEKLIDIGFCFDEFCKAVAAKDAKVAAAFIDELPADLQKLDLKKPAGQEAFCKALAKFSGAQVEAAQKMHGMGEVTYTDKNGNKQTQRMQMRGGVWKITGL